jgi:hypothetical protein
MMYGCTVTLLSVGLEVLTAVVSKSSVFRDIMLCSPATFSGQHGIISQKIELFIFVQC